MRSGKLLIVGGKKKKKKKKKEKLEKFLVNPNVGPPAPPQVSPPYILLKNPTAEIKKEKKPQDTSPVVPILLKKVEKNVSLDELYESIISFYVIDKNKKAIALARLAVQSLSEDPENLHKFQDLLITKLLDGQPTALRFQNIIKYAPQLIKLFTQLQTEKLIPPINNQSHLGKIYQLQTLAYFMTLKTNSNKLVNEALINALKCAENQNISLTILIENIFAIGKATELDNFKKDYLTLVKPLSLEMKKVLSKTSCLIDHYLVPSAEDKKPHILGIKSLALSAYVPRPLRAKEVTISPFATGGKEIQTLLFKALNKYTSAKTKQKDEKIVDITQAIAILKKIKEKSPSSYEAKKADKLFYKYFQELGMLYSNPVTEKNLLIALKYYNEAMRVVQASDGNLNDVYQCDAYLQISVVKVALANITSDLEKKRYFIAEAEQDLFDAQNVEDPSSKIISLCLLIKLYFNNPEYTHKGCDLLDITTEVLKNRKKEIDDNKNELHTFEVYKNKINSSVALLENYIQHLLENTFTRDNFIAAYQEILQLNEKFISLLLAAEDDELNKYLSISYERSVSLILYIDQDDLVKARSECEAGLNIFLKFPDLIKKTPEQYYILNYKYAYVLFKQGDFINSKKYAEQAVPYQSEYSDSLEVTHLLQQIEDQRVTVYHKEILAQLKTGNDTLEKINISIDSVSSLLKLLDKLQLLRTSYKEKMVENLSHFDLGILKIDQTLAKGYKKLHDIVLLLKGFPENIKLISLVQKILAVVTAHVNDNYSNFDAIELVLKLHQLHINSHIKSHQQQDVLLECKAAQAFIARTKSNTSIAKIAREFYNIQTNIESEIVKKIFSPLQEAKKKTNNLVNLKKEFNKKYSNFKKIKSRFSEDPTQALLAATQQKEEISKLLLVIQARYNEVEPILKQVYSTFLAKKSLLTSSMKSLAHEIKIVKSAMQKISEFLSSGPLAKIEALYAEILRKQPEEEEVTQLAFEAEKLRQQQEQAIKVALETETLRKKQAEEKVETAETEFIQNFFPLPLVAEKAPDKKNDTNDYNILNKIAKLNVGLNSDSDISPYKLCVVMRGTAVLQFFLGQGAKDDIHINAKDSDLFIYNVPSFIKLPMYNGKNDDRIRAAELDNYKAEKCNQALANLLKIAGFTPVKRTGSKSPFYENYHSLEENIDITVCRIGYYSYDPFHFTRSGLCLNEKGEPYVFAQELKKDIDNKEFELDLPVVGNLERKVTGFFTRLIKYHTKLKDISGFKFGKNFQEALSYDWQLGYFKEILASCPHMPRHPVYLEMISIIKNGQFSLDNKLATQIVGTFCDALAIIIYDAVLDPIVREVIVESLRTAYIKNPHALANFYYYLQSLFKEHAHLEPLQPPQGLLSHLHMSPTEEGWYSPRFFSFSPNSSLSFEQSPLPQEVTSSPEFLSPPFSPSPSLCCRHPTLTFSREDGSYPQQYQRPSGVRSAPPSHHSGNSSHRHQLSREVFAIKSTRPYTSGAFQFHRSASTPLSPPIDLIGRQYSSEEGSPDSSCSPGQFMAHQGKEHLPR